jgi:hypothetical protein
LNLKILNSDEGMIPEIILTKNKDIDTLDVARNIFYLNSIHRLKNKTMLTEEVKETLKMIDDFDTNNLSSPYVFSFNFKPEELMNNF